MRATRLEIFGFKSFMDRLVIPLEGGITGVVGPNGCGKSNVVDALRWVLGETRASSLRGDVLEDIIFSGTEKLRPLGLAEVSISLKATSKDFFTDLVDTFQSVDFSTLPAEVPAVSEENGVESVISKSESGILEDSERNERPHLTVISGSLGAPQERNDDAVTVDDSSATSEVLKQSGGSASAEADAGTQSSSEGSAKQSPAPFLSRYAWLGGTQEVQVTRRIYRSGESEFFINRVPCRLRDIKEFFRIVGLGARAHSIVAQGEVTRMISAKPEERRAMFEEVAGVLGFKDKIAAAHRRLEETGVNISRIDDIIKEVTKQVSSLKRQAQRAEARDELKSKLAELEARLFVESLNDLRKRISSHDQLIDESKRTAETTSAELEKRHAEEQKYRAEMAEIDSHGDRLRAQVDAIKEELNSRLRARTAVSTKINEVKAYILSRSAEIERMGERLTTLENRSLVSEEDLEKLTTQEQELVQSLNGLEQVTQDDVETTTKALEELRKSVRTLEDRIRAVREQEVAADSRARAIEEQLESLSPAEQLKATLGGEGARILTDLNEEIRLFADGLKVPQELEGAIQAVLGERAAFLVSQRPFAIAERFAEVSARLQKNIGKNKLGIGVLRAGPADPGSHLAIHESDAPGRSVLSLIEVSESCAHGAALFLGGIHFVENLSDATRYIEERRHAGSPSNLQFVTAAGELVRDAGFVSFRGEGGLIPMKNRIRELRTEQERFASQAQELRAERDVLNGQVQGAEVDRDAALERAAERQRKVRDIANQLGEIRGRAQSERRVREQVVQDIVKLKQQISDSKRSVDDYRLEQEAAEEQMAQLVPEGEEALKEQLAVLTKEYGEIDAQRGTGRRAAALAASAVESLRRQLDGIRQSLSQRELEQQRLSLEMEHAMQRFQDEYGSEKRELILSEQSQPMECDSRALEAMKSEALNIRNRIVREGEVDPTSIERYKEESLRLEELTNQRADLESAAVTLKETISRLSDTSRELFLKTYQGVSAHFERLVPRLFGGGKGELRLSDPENPLQSGVEVMVRPPGKKPNSIELLSGGEKALCATALIFAMFLERPSPLCVLDEVDAPLDEANLVRFISMVKEMSTKTQFIMITHNKQSMANADRLVGVTMQEPGASKILTVSLDEAYSQVA
jgi:chromosome segregation protein